MVPPSQNNHFDLDILELNNLGTSEYAYKCILLFTN